MLIDRDFKRWDKRRKNSPKVDCRLRTVARYNSAEPSIVIVLDECNSTDDQSVKLSMNVAEALQLRDKLSAMLEFTSADRSIIDTAAEVQNV